MTIATLFAARLRATGVVDADDLRALSALPQVTFAAPAETPIARNGEDLDCATVLLQGLACRSKARGNGARQILAIHIPGDGLDLVPALETRDASIEALILCRGVRIAHEALAPLLRQRPGLANAFARMAAVDANMAAERILSLGRRAALERMAHFFCELAHRMDSIGLGVRGRYDLPLTQAELGDALGLSVVHVNRTLQQLRGSGLISFRGQRLVVHEIERLCEMAEFDPGYLRLARAPAGIRSHTAARQAVGERPSEVA